MDAAKLKQSPLWEHLSDVVAVILQEKPEQPLELFELLSHHVLTGKLVPEPAKTAAIVEDSKRKRLLKLSENQNTEWAQKFVLQVVPPKKEPKLNEDGEPEEEEPEEEQEDKGNLPDVLAEAQMFNWCGVGLGEAEMYRLVVSMTRLLAAQPLGTLRFWGKIFGLKKDYYICEGEIDPERVQEEEAQEEPEEDEEKPVSIYDQLNTYKAKPKPVIKPEARGSGSNKYVYYVASSDDLTTWTELPDVKPEWVLAARKVQKYFTGDLEAPVKAHPPFPGVEKHLLRAQIARITHGTLLVPKNVFTPNDAPEEEEEDEEGNKKPKKYNIPAYEEIPEISASQPPDAEDEEAVEKVKVWFKGFKDDALLQLSNWVHLLPPLLQSQGRASLFKFEEEEPEEGADETVEKPPPPPPEQIHPRLSDLSHDKPRGKKRKPAKKGKLPQQPQATPLWTVHKGFHIPSSNNRLYICRSQLWPGACTVAKCTDEVPGAVYSNVYIGYGVKQDVRAKTFAPRLPPVLLPEFQQPKEGILQINATPDDEILFAKPPEPEPVEGEGAEGEGEEEEEEEDQ